MVPEEGINSKGTYDVMAEIWWPVVETALYLIPGKNMRIV
jgi:hypothetical protein